MIGRRNKSKQKARVYAFIDSQNLNVSTQKQGWKIDWKKFRQFLTDKYDVSQAFMFIGYLPEQERMYEQLHESGYSVVLKPTFDMTRPRPEENNEPGKPDSEKEQPHIKGNVDADLVLWVMKEHRNYDKAVIVSGDGDFFTLIEHLKQQGRLLKLLAPNAHYSGLYNIFADYIDVVEKHRRDLAYREHKRKR